MPVATLNGFFRDDFVADGPVLIKIGDSVEGMAPPQSVLILDARTLQGSTADNAASSFFRERGFCLIHHRSDVRHWTSNDEITKTYLPEVEQLIRQRLLHDTPVEIHQTALSMIRRGPGMGAPFYAEGVHQDYGLSADDYQENLEAYGSPAFAAQWRDRYEQDDVDGFMVINFWRTIHMKSSLRHMPLALCDPHTVHIRDVIPSGLVDFTPTGKLSNQLSLRFHQSQKWYYYPEMTSDEVLAFKVFECFKGRITPRLETCFHSAFRQAGIPEGIEERKSCEHRVGLFFLRMQ